MDDRIDAIQRRAAANPWVIGLAGGLPSEAQFPKRALARSFIRVLGQSGAPAPPGRLTRLALTKHGRIVLASHEERRVP